MGTDLALTEATLKLQGLASLESGVNFYRIEIGRYFE